MSDRKRGSRLVAVVVLALTLCWCALLAVPHAAGRSGPTDDLEYRLLDLRYRLLGPGTPASNVMILAIDDRTLASETARGQSRRETLALLLTRLSESGAQVVALDVLLADRGEVDVDVRLATALSLTPTVIAAAARFDTNRPEEVVLIQPQARFRGSAQEGLVNLSTDTGGTPRYVPLLVNVEGQLMPSLPLQAVLERDGTKASFGKSALSLGGREIPLDLGFNMPLRFLGPEGTVPTISASTLLDEATPDTLSGKLVVLGYSAAAMGDRFATPYDDSTPGMELIATAISQLSGGPTLRRDMQTRRWDAAHGAVLAVMCVAIVLLWPLSRGIPAALVPVAMSLIAITTAFASGIWLSAALPLASAAPPMILAGALRYRQERAEASRSERTAASLRRFQDPALARKLERDPEYLATPQEEVLVILFIDLTGFTALSQQLGTEGTRKLLRSFHGLTARAVEAEGGSVFNYMGDGAMAVFGMEDDTGATAADAAHAAAFALVRSLSEENMACRIGLHRGPATLSRLGAESHQQVTVTGDTVNLASRLMEVAKDQKAVIVASEEFDSARAARGQDDGAFGAEVAIRGREGYVTVLCWTENTVRGTAPDYTV